MATSTDTNAAVLAALGALERKMDERMSSMREELREDRRKAEDRLVKKIKIDKAPTFKKKGHEKQYLFNASVDEKLGEAAAALETVPSTPQVQKAKEILKEGEELINNRQKQIKIADRSEYGWATVDEYVDDELAKDSDDEKRLFRAEGRAKHRIKSNEEKKKKRPFVRASYRGRDATFHKQTMSGFRYQGGISLGDNSNVVRGAGGSSSYWQRKPEFLQGSIGPCFQCGKMGKILPSPE